MIITRKPMGRRTVLRGMGTTLALPLLEAMASGVPVSFKSRSKIAP